MKKLGTQIEKNNMTASFSNRSSRRADSVRSSVPLYSKPCRKCLVVQHDYHDHANDGMPEQFRGNSCPVSLLSIQRGQAPFPVKLHIMLEEIEKEGYSDIIAWQPHGRCFIIHDPERLRIEVLPRFFPTLSKLASFQRQLNLYGFVRLTRQGSDRGGYYHEKFLRYRAWLALNIPRIKVKGTGVRARSNPAEEPDFWNKPYVLPPDQQPQQEQPMSPDLTPITSGGGVDTRAHNKPFFLQSDIEQQVDGSLTIPQDLASVASVVSHEDEYQQQPPLQTASTSSFQHCLFENELVMSDWGMPFYEMSSSVLEADKKTPGFSSSDYEPISYMANTFGVSSNTSGVAAV